MAVIAKDKRDSNRLLRVLEVAARLGVSYGTVYRLMHEGSLACLRSGRRSYRVTQEALETFIKSGGVKQHVTLNPDRLWTPEEAFKQLRKVIHQHHHEVIRVALESSAGQNYFLRVRDEAKVKR